MPAHPADLDESESILFEAMNAATTPIVALMERIGIKSLMIYRDGRCARGEAVLHAFREPTRGPRAKAGAVVEGADHA